MGGEKHLFRIDSRFGMGSPPRGRGKDICRHPFAVVAVDHPRVGGEKLRFRAVPTRELGSPPRGRGKAAEPRPSLGPEGITPAWAGKSRSFWSFCTCTGDHPRVGGEKEARDYPKEQVWGSPPRGRGKDASEFAGFIVEGITPAWAGKSLGICACFPLVQDHPRVGGEKTHSMHWLSFRLGSPPRGRGKGALGVSRSSGFGITPAWAGKRLKRSHRSGIFISGPIPFHSVLHRPAGSGGSRAGRDGSLAGQPQNAGPA